MPPINTHTDVSSKPRGLNFRLSLNLHPYLEFFFCLIWFLTSQSTIVLLCWDRSSWVEPVLSKDKCVLLKDITQWHRWGSNPQPHSLIRNEYNQVPHLTHDTNRKVTNSVIHHKREPRGQPFPSRWPQGTNKQTCTKALQTQARNNITLNHWATVLPPYLEYASSKGYGKSTKISHTASFVLLS